MSGDRLPAALYHWSPAERRASIEAHGLRPGHPSIDGTWNPPYLCLATSPHHAWWLNLQHHRDTSASWDLWQVYSEDVIEPYPRGDYPAEIRTKHPVRQAYLLASRDSTPIVPASMATGEDGIRALIARSSFGTAEAQEAIASIDPERATRLVRRSIRP